jgi:hypothetical protein
MPPQPQEPLPQRELLYRLRAAIDTARRYPTMDNTERALALAREHPRGLRSKHLQHLLGRQRFDWLAEYGITTIGEPVEIAGIEASKKVITPEVTK